MLRLYKPQMVFFIEKIRLKKNRDCSTKYDFPYGFEVGADRTKGGIYLAWKSGIIVFYENIL